VAGIVRPASLALPLSMRRSTVWKDRAHAALRDLRKRPRPQSRRLPVVHFERLGIPLRDARDPATRRPTSPVTLSRGCSGVHPCSKRRDSFLWPRFIARHRAIAESLVDRLGVIAHFVVGRQVEGPGHLLDVAIPEQRPDVGREGRRPLIHVLLLSLVSRSRRCLEHGPQAGSIKRSRPHARPRLDRSMSSPA
jgi:hypothetical protein